MKCLKLSGPEGLRIGKCLFGSRCGTSKAVISRLGATNTLLCNNDGLFWLSNDVSTEPQRTREIIIPIQTMVFDPFAALGEKIPVTLWGNRSYTGKSEIITCISDKIYAIGNMAYDIEEISEITLDIEWACTLEGIEVIEI